MRLQTDWLFKNKRDTGRGTVHAAPAPAAKRPFAQACFEWAEALVIALIIAFVLFTFVVHNHSIDGASMEPSFVHGQRLLVSCVDRGFRYGDVIVIDRHRTDPDVYPIIVKRVIATAGQTVDVDAEMGMVIVDGRPLDESAYIENGITERGDFPLPVTIPEGHLFALGDNRRVSEDSRDSRVGIIECRQVIGKAVWMLWPFGPLA